MTLNEAAIDRKNNLNIIRLVASIMVLYMHSFAICLGDQSGDIFGALTFGKELAGGIAVDIFFIISGFLICRSFDRTKNTKRYFIARFLRLWPILFVTVMITTFIVGPIVSEHNLEVYFAGDILGYLRNLIFVSSDNMLPGCFLYHYNHSMNGSLWTLQFEVLCYIEVWLFSFIWQRFKTTVPVSAIGLAVLHLIYSTGNGIDVGPVSQVFLNNFFRLNMFFAVGMTYYLYADLIKLKLQFFIASVALLILGTYFADFSVMFAIFGSYIIFYIAFQKRFIATWYDKIGDLSYGIYIMAFPIQQIVLDWLGTPTEYYGTMSMNPYLNMLVTMAILLPLSWLSWHFVEQPCLNLKNIKK